jgi:hypothetical protein
MEFTKTEILVVEEVAKNADAQMSDLTDLQLTLIGGGSGDVIFA